MEAVNAATNAVPAAYLVDGSLYVFRAWHSMPNDFFDVDGHPINAVHGYTRFLCELLERAQPEHIAVAFDASLTSSFRNAIYPAYKANRELPPPELEFQFGLCQELTTALGLAVAAHSSFEADDLIGSALWTLRRHGYRSVVVSADKDFGQLLGSHDEQWDFARGERWGADGVMARMGVRPEQVADFLALAGDAVDNVPGVRGIGPRTAAALLAHFGDLDALLARIDEVAALSLRGAAGVAVRLREQAGNALLSRRLTRIALDAPVPEAAALAWRGGDGEALEGLSQQLRLGAHTRARLRAQAQPKAEIA